MQPAQGPYVLAHGGFSIENASRSTSTGFASNRGDAIVVWTAIYGQDTIASVTDSAGDVFTQVVNASMAFGPSGASNGLSVWLAANVSGGTSVSLTETLHSRFSTSPSDAAVVFADATGVAPVPLDALGPVRNSSNYTNQQTRNFTSVVNASASDLLLTGVGARNYDDFTGSGITRVAQSVGVLTKPAVDAVTSSVFESTEGPVGGATWMNASDNQTAAWIAVALALRPAGPPPAHEYWVTLNEAGLANGTTWTASVGNASVAALAPEGVRVAEANGTYRFLIGAVPGYRASPNNVTVVVNGSGPTDAIAFSSLHSITFLATGLATGAAWSVQVGNQTVSGSGPTSTSVSEYDGTYPFTVSATGYSATPRTGSVLVNGTSVTTTVEFGKNPGNSVYTASFTESGLPFTASWSVTAGNQTTNASAGTIIDLLEPSGSIAYKIASSSGFVPNPASGTVMVRTGPVNTNVNFGTPKSTPNGRSNVTWSESGLASGTAWTVQVGPQNLQAKAPQSISASLPNGTSNYKVAMVQGYTSFPASGTVYVTGSPVRVSIAFDSGVVVKFAAGGLPGGAGWSVDLANVTRSALGNVAITFGEGTGTYAYSIPSVEGFVPNPSHGTVTVGTAAINVNVHFAAPPNPSYNVTVVPRGLPNATNWSFSVGTATHSATAPAALTFSATPSTYTFSASAGAGFAPDFSSGQLVIGKAPVNLTIGFHSTTLSTGYPLNFYEVGLPDGTGWSVTVGGLVGRGTAPSAIGFSLANGSYPFSQPQAAGYAPSVTSGNVSIQGASASRTLGFTLRFQHVVTIVMENEASATVLSGAPYQAYLAAKYATATHFYGACHYSYPNYVAMTSGRYFACGTASIPIEGVTNIADLIEKANLSWMGYFEGMTTACQVASNGSYVSFHNPFILYKDIRYNTSRCDHHVVNSASFNASVANGTLPSYSYYVPNISDDCYRTALSFCDQWLASFLSPILNSTKPAVQKLVASTLFLIVYDEGEESGAAFDAGYSAGPGYVNTWCKNTTGQALSACGGLTYLVAVSPWSSKIVFTPNVSDYNLETTVEWFLNLGGSDGGWDGTSAFPAMESLVTG
ncbi:MAG TPA: alkaline phosphatase family protein [Thermoplasmata archaeon]|nr:alkaline phosphatase family protein [Thermoplasmata archaeon]